MNIINSNDVKRLNSEYEYLHEIELKAKDICMDKNYDISFIMRRRFDSIKDNPRNNNDSLNFCFHDKKLKNVTEKLMFDYINKRKKEIEYELENL